MSSVQVSGEAGGGASDIVAAGFFRDGHTRSATSCMGRISVENELAKFIFAMVPNENEFDEQCMRIGSSIERITSDAWRG